jgi:pimeloyl-ACP methyl ester carboxylesterase
VTRRLGLPRRLLSHAAAGLDRAVTLALRVAHAPTDYEPNVGTGHEARVLALQAIIDRFEALDLTGFFPEPRAIEPLERTRGRYGALARAELSWQSLHDTFLPELSATFGETLENHVAVARVYTRAAPRPVAVLVHGYLFGKLAVDERVWPLRELDALGFDSALYVLPFHGRRANRAHVGRRPEFPGLDPRFASEGFRQAVTELRELMRLLRQRGHAKVGLFGMSLGGYTAALTATVDSTLDFLVPIVPLASLADFAREQGDLPEAPEPRALEHALLERAFRHVSPVHREPLVSPERVLVLGGKADRIVPISHARRIASHFHAELATFGGGHVLQWGMGEGFEKVRALLKRVAS